MRQVLLAICIIVTSCGTFYYPYIRLRVEAPNRPLENRQTRIIAEQVAMVAIAHGFKEVPNLGPDAVRVDPSLDGSRLFLLSNEVALLWKPAINELYITPNEQRRGSLSMMDNVAEALTREIQQLFPELKIRRVDGERAAKVSWPSPI